MASDHPRQVRRSRGAPHHLRQTSAPASTTGRAPIGITSPKPRLVGCGRSSAWRLGETRPHLRVNASGPGNQHQTAARAARRHRVPFPGADDGRADSAASPRRSRRWRAPGHGCSRPPVFVFGDALVDASIPPERGWAALALYAAAAGRRELRRRSSTRRAPRACA